MRTRALLLSGCLVAALGVAMFAWGRPETAEAVQQQVQDTAKYVAPTDVDTANLPGPKQPIFYRHDVHAGQYQMDCRYCHFAAEVSTSPGLPTVSTCMGCHIIAAASNPEVQKLRKYWNDKEAIPWTEIHVLPPFVHFPHDRHVMSDSADFKGKSVPDKCEICHGPIRRMPQVYEFASLKMGWCVDCHKKSEVNTDCTACHY